MCGKSHRKSVHSRKGISDKMCIRDRSEVYSVTTKGTSVNFPANSVYSAVASATGFGLSSIQLLELPASTAGVLYVGSYAADTTSAYSYGSDTDSMKMCIRDRSAPDPGS